MSRDTTYRVYLVPVETGDDEPTVESPVTADRIDFYDSGVWIDHAGGRDFFPYERVRRIREGAEEPAASQESGEESAASGGESAVTGEESAASGGESAVTGGESTASGGESALTGDESAGQDEA